MGKFMQLTTMDYSDTVSAYLISAITSVPLGKVKTLIDELANLDQIAMPQIVFHPGASGQYRLARIDAELVIKEVKLKFCDTGKNCFGNYVVYFSGSQRVKIGITENFDKRMTYYTQEAQRHGLGAIQEVFFPTLDEAISRNVEATLIKHLELHAVQNTREWFVGGMDLYDCAIFSTINRISSLKSAEFARVRKRRNSINRLRSLMHSTARLTGRDYPQITGGLVTA